MSVVDDLIARSNRLGSDPRNTNYAVLRRRPGFQLGLTLAWRGRRR